MKEEISAPTCERANDLMAFLYGETGDRETRDFERHLQSCDQCRADLTAFGPLHNSIGAWRDQSLGMASQPASRVPEFSTARPQSAMAAITQFFNLAPLWMKGAAAFALLLLCASLTLTVSRLFEKPASRDFSAADKIYSQSDLERELAARMDKERKAAAAAQGALPAKEVVSGLQPPKSSTKSDKRDRTRSTTSVAKQLRKPLSRSEREQLAADLRLVTATGEDELELLGDKINR